MLVLSVYIFSAWTLFFPSSFFDCPAVSLCRRPCSSALARCQPKPFILFTAQDPDLIHPLGFLFQHSNISCQSSASSLALSDSKSAHITMSRSFLFYYAFFFLASLALAAPTTSSRLKGRSFQVDRVQRDGYVAHGPAALRKAYRKFNISSSTTTTTTTATTASTDSGLQALDFAPINHHHLNSQSAAATANSSSADQNGTVATSSVNGDVEFVSAVSIGGQTIMMDFDTGSSDLYVYPFISNFHLLTFG